MIVIKKNMKILNRRRKEEFTPEYLLFLRELENRY